MNKKYMDFVPAGKSATRKAVAEKPATGGVKPVASAKPAAGAKPVAAKAKPAKREVSEPTYDEIDELDFQKLFEERDAVKSAKRNSSAADFGVIEDYHAKFVKTEVKKRPLSRGGDEDLKTLKIPKTQFVNLEKVEKRPLSKNVYKKKVVTPKEVPSGPVTIISKPEKDSKAGLIVTIIITIILGAAAGTVAFLLLPK